MTVDLTGRRVLRALAVTLCFGTAALSGPAHAQFFGWGGWEDGNGGGGLPGPRVRQSITEQGFRVIGPLRRNGNVFVADVVDRRGRHERLIVASADAQILQRFYVDDGRDPHLFARGDETDDGGGLVPPADIPGVARPRLDQPRRFAAPPADPSMRVRRFDEPAAGDDPDTAVVEPQPPRGQPPIRTVRPGPRVVERMPEVPERRDAAPVEATPLAPVAPKPRVVEPPARAAVPKAPAAATVASRPDPTPAVPAPAAPTSQPRRLTDPLAIPGGPDKTAEHPPVRSVSGGITGAPAAATAAPATAAPATAPVAKPGDVPAAPLD